MRRNEQDAKENEIRRLLSKAWSRRRRKADVPRVRNALHLDLNQEFEEPRGDGIKYLLRYLGAVRAADIRRQPDGWLGVAAAAAPAELELDAKPLGPKFSRHYVNWGTSSSEQIGLISSSRPSRRFLPRLGARREWRAFSYRTAFAISFFKFPNSAEGGILRLGSGQSEDFAMTHKSATFKFVIWTTGCRCAGNNKLVQHRQTFSLHRSGESKAGCCHQSLKLPSFQIPRFRGFACWFLT